MEGGGKGGFLASDENKVATETAFGTICATWSILCIKETSWKEILWIFVLKCVTFFTFQDRIMTIQFGNTGGRYANYSAAHRQEVHAPLF